MTKNPMLDDPVRSSRVGGRARRIVYICDWLPPDYGAVGQYSLLFARALAADGFDVVLAGLTSGPEGTEIEDMANGQRLQIIRLHADRYDKSSVARRLVWTLRANALLIRRLWSQLRAADEIVFTGSPPLFLHLIAPANLLLRKELTYRITDFHPECAMAERQRIPLWMQALYHLTLFWRRRVTTFEVLGHDQIQRLEDLGFPRQRMRLKPDPSPVAIPPGTVPLPRPPEVAGKVLLLYSGNWGVAHDYRTFVEAYRRHHVERSGRVVLWLNAVGATAGRVETAVRELGLPLVRGEPVPLDQLASLLVTPDAHLITLSDAFVGYVLPSKVHGCIESGKPVLYIGSERSDVHRLCASKMTADYAHVSVGDVDRCVDALDALGRLAPRVKDGVAAQ